MNIIRRRARSVQGGLPAPIDETFVNGEHLYQNELLNDGIVIPSQLPPEPPEEYAPIGHAEGKQDWQANRRNIAKHLPNFDPDRGLIEREIVHPGTINLTNFSGMTLGVISGRLALSQVFTRRKDRKRFILCNPDVKTGGSGEPIFFCYKNTPNGLLPIYPGQEIDESGSEVSGDDIWICGSTAGGAPVAFVAYEGRLHGIYD